MKISLYIHIPFCISKCDYCDFFSVPVSGQQSHSIQKTLLDTIITELEIKLENIPAPSIETIFIGGGTPSIIDPQIFYYFLNKLSVLISGLLSPEAEFTTEANIESCSKSFLSAASEGGINRLSIGLQSFDPAILREIGRARFPDDILGRVGEIKTQWVGDISMDIISGISSGYIKDINLATSFNPDHLSVYQLTVEENTELFNLVESGKRSAPDEVLQLKSIKEINRLLESKNYIRYEISNYALNGKICLHNLRYWEMQSYLGLGPSAVTSVYREDSKYRTSNVKNIEKYIDDIKNGSSDYQQREELSNFDFLLEHYIMGGRLCKGINEQVFFNRFGKYPVDFIPHTVEKWKKQKLIDEGSIPNAALNEEGLLFLDSFLSDVYSELSENYGFLKISP